MSVTVDEIMAFENGELDEAEILTLFSGLVKSGQAWTLQGSYGRFAARLIDGGYLSETGEILNHV